MSNSGDSGPFKEPVGEHGTRSQFIKDVSERLIQRVNDEAANVDEAKSLMQQYMMEFCAEYDRCGYGMSVKSSTKSGIDTEIQKNDGRSLQTDNINGFSDRISTQSTSQGNSQASSPCGSNGANGKKNNNQ